MPLNVLLIGNAHSPGFARHPRGSMHGFLSVPLQGNKTFLCTFRFHGNRDRDISEQKESNRNSIPEAKGPPLRFCGEPLSFVAPPVSPVAVVSIRHPPLPAACFNMTLFRVDADGTALATGVPLVFLPPPAGVGRGLPRSAPVQIRNRRQRAFSQESPPKFLVGWYCSVNVPLLRCGSGCGSGRALETRNGTCGGFPPEVLAMMSYEELPAATRREAVVGFRTLTAES